MIILPSEPRAVEHLFQVVKDLESQRSKDWILTCRFVPHSLKMFDPKYLQVNVLISEYVSEGPALT